MVPLEGVQLLLGNKWAPAFVFTHVQSPVFFRLSGMAHPHTPLPSIQCMVLCLQFGLGHRNCPRFVETLRRLIENGLVRSVWNVRRTSVRSTFVDVVYQWHQRIKRLQRCKQRSRIQIELRAAGGPWKKMQRRGCNELAGSWRVAEH